MKNWNYYSYKFRHSTTEVAWFTFFSHCKAELSQSDLHAGLSHPRSPWVAISGRVLGVQFYHCSGTHFSGKRCSFARILLPCVSDGFTRWQSLPTSSPYLTVYLVLFLCTCGLYALECARRQALTPKQDFGGGCLPPSYPALLLQDRVFLRRSSLLMLPVGFLVEAILAGSVCLCYTMLGLMGTHSHAWPFTNVQGNQTQDSILSEQELYPLRLSPAPGDPLSPFIYFLSSQKRNFYFTYVPVCVRTCIRVSTGARGRYWAT